MHSSDLAILYFLNQTIASTTMDAIVSVLTNVTYWYAIYVLAAVFVIWRYKWHGVRLVVGAVVLVAICDSLSHYLLKPWIDRVRPCAVLPNGQHVVSWIRLPVGPRLDPSFPSNHALNNFAVGTLFAMIYPNKKAVRWIFVIAILISIGRVYEGLHYPTDVVGGALIGMVAGLLFSLATAYVEERLAGRVPLPEYKEELSLEDQGAVDLGAATPATKRLWVK